MTVPDAVSCSPPVTGTNARWHVERGRHRAAWLRRYLAVDPDNRLIAEGLEAERNDALRALQAAREDYDGASAAATATSPMS